MRVEEARERIAAHPDSGAFISLSDERGSGPVVAVKDAIDVRGCRTTAGALPSEEGPWPDGTGPQRDPGGVALRDAAAVERLHSNGCVVVGKTNLHEFCLGPTSENPHYGAVRNPRDPARIAGGSSGGSAAAVALGMCDWALGTDTSGSVRIPAALCGVVGVKPTTGLVETTGTVPMSRTQDTIGVLARDVATAASALAIVSGLDTTPVAPAGLPRLAVPEAWDAGLAPDVAATWGAVAGHLPRVRLPDLDRLVAAGRTIILAEAAAIHRRRLAAEPQLYGQDVRELLTAASRVSRQAYVAALLDAGALRAEVDAVLQEWDALLLPATRVTATLLGEPVAQDDLTALTRPLSVTGHPVVCLPGPSSGLPVGVQVVGRHGGDAGVLTIAAGLERAWAEGLRAGGPVTT